MTHATDTSPAARRRARFDAIAAATVFLLAVLCLAVAASGELVLVFLLSAVLVGVWLLLRHLQQ